MIKGFVLLMVATLSLPVMARSDISFDDYVKNLKQEAKDYGISTATVDTAFAQVKFHQRAVKADKQQPEFKLTLDQYIPRAVPDWKVKQARDIYKKHYPLLEEISEAYGVQPRFLVALWGVESNFGRLMGSYNVISALTTMSYEGRREEFFKKELMYALEIIDQGHISVPNMKGSWAGAMGQFQFMPSSFKSYAVDFTGNGQKNIWTSKPDTLASAANYLSKHGWQSDQTWGRQVKLTQDLPEEIVGLKVQKSLAEWQELGVRRFDGSDLPLVDMQASIVMPDDKNGRVYLAYENYRILMKWNRSYYFVSAVGHLADRISYPPVF